MILWSNKKHVYYNPFYDELFVISNRMCMIAEKLGLVYIGEFNEGE